MAGTALVTQRTLVRIILGMTGSAVHRRTFEDAIDMTACAGSRGMFPVEVERELRVIHCGGLPTIGRVTGCAVGPELTVMGIIHSMAGETILRGSFQIGESMCIDVTGRAFLSSMLSNQVKWHFVMIKI